MVLGELAPDSWALDSQASDHWIPGPNLPKNLWYVRSLILHGVFVWFYGIILLFYDMVLLYGYMVWLGFCFPSTMFSGQEHSVLLDMMVVLCT